MVWFNQGLEESDPYNMGVPVHTFQPLHLGTGYGGKTTKVWGLIPKDGDLTLSLPNPVIMLYPLLYSFTAPFCACLMFYH